MSDPDVHSREDQATLYVLGQLDASERRIFEAHLAQSAELRALVRELEEGAAALAIAAPRRRPPPDLWQRIESKLARQPNRSGAIAAFLPRYWRNGWAAAAACIIGWLLYALWVNRTNPPAVPPVPVASETAPHQAVTPSNSGHRETEPATRVTTETDAALNQLQARTQEIGALRWQLAELTNRMFELSETLAQQRVLLFDPSRLKFFQLTLPPAGGGDGPVAAPVSTNLQRAILLAAARELGWWPFPASAQAPPVPASANKHGQKPDSFHQAGVDFVDLKPGNNEAENAASLKSLAAADPANASAWSSPSSLSSNAIPGFVAGTNAVLAFDSFAVPTGSSLTFLTANSWGQYSTLGTAVLGNNPLIVRVPVARTALTGTNITVFAISAAGAASILGEFAVPMQNGR